jgi:hypothetical protein
MSMLCGLIVVDTYGPDKVGVGETVGVTVGVPLGVVVPVGVGVAATSITFYSGWFNPTVIKPFVKVVRLSSEL